VHQVLHQLSVRRNAVLLLCALLLACSPSKETVSADFGELFAKEVGPGARPVVKFVSAGEGDSDNVYQHVRFDVVAGRDTTLTTGWLAGTSLRAGQELYDGEAVLLYQKQAGSDWKLTRSELARAPSPHKAE
jgi:hypothetical protein